MPRDEYDSIVYDCRFGWINPHPEHFLASIGVTVDEHKGDLIYTIDRPGYYLRLEIPMDTHWHVLRAVIDDAEYRATGRVSS